MTPPSSAPPIDAAPIAAAAEPSSEADLIHASLRGDQRAFGEIVRAHERRVYNFLHQFTHHRHDAEDLTQQTFIKAYHHLKTFDARRPLINWLLTIARHAAINHFRDTKKWSELPFDAAGDGLSPAASAEHKDRAANLWARAREILSAREFEVLWLRFGEELSTEETAHIVGLTQTHVKVLVHRARKALLKGET